ncbi:MAG: hypothetical protein ACM3SM_03740 [Bacteroidota bacterium]
MKNEILSFTEEQRLRQPWVKFAAIPVMSILAVFLLWFAAARFLTGRLSGSSPVADSDMIWMVLIITAIILIILYLLLRVKLTVTVSDKNLHIRYFPLVNRSIELDEILSCKAVRYKPLREYGGWGIRFSIRGRGMAYTVSGNMGVDIVLKNGKRILIGSARSEELCRAIQKKNS